MNLRPLLFIPPILIGLVGFNLMTRESGVSPPPETESRLAVRVTKIKPHPVSATAIGFGRVKAESVWSAVSEVQGRITSLAEDLAIGEIVDAGETLVEIDQTDITISRQKSLANIAAAEARLLELDRQEENSRKTLEVEESILDVAKAEYERAESLVGRGAASPAVLDSSRKTLLTQTTAVTNRRNTIALFPSQRKSLEATLAVRRAELAEAERALEKTTIKAPFRGRIAKLEVETDQFVRAGELLLTLEDTGAVEVTAEFPMSSFVPMIMIALGDQFQPDAIVDTSQATTFLKDVGVTAEVGMSIAGMTPVWPAEIVRLRGTMDSATGTLGFVVRVRDPLTSQRQLNRPPLNVGSFVSVTLSTRPVDGSLTVPRSALRYTDTGEPFVYVSDKDNRLQVASVKTGQVIGEEVVVFEGLDSSATLVLSDPHPPVIGMALDPVLIAGDS